MGLFSHFGSLPFEVIGSFRLLGTLFFSYCRQLGLKGLQSCFHLLFGLIERKLALLVALQGESIWKGDQADTVRRYNLQSRSITVPQPRISRPRLDAKAGGQGLTLRLGAKAQGKGLRPRLEAKA